ncbi:MAG TPA: PAS domain S-box protein, partial [Anaerolineales bacterium]|nr:PAS domain S-box protein [Anaerolineales bacterium]
RLENIQLREAVAIYDLSQTISFSLDSKLVLEKTLDAALKQTNADEGSIMLLTPSGDELRIVAVRGQGRDGLLGQRTPLTSGIAGWAARQSEALILNGEVTDDRFAPLWPHPEIRSAISIPMTTAGKLIGVLNVHSLQARRPFTTGQAKALSIITGTAAAALDNQALYSALEQREKHFRALIENAPDAIAVNAPDGTVLYVSPAVEKITGIQAELGKKVDPFQRIHPEDMRVSRDMLKQILQTPGIPALVQFRIQHPNGEWRWLEVVGTNLIGESSVDGIVVNFSDITERKRAEERLRYQAYLLSNVNDAIIATDENFQITYWNHAAETLYGWSEEEALGMYGPEITKTEFMGIDTDAMLQHIREIGVWRGEVTQVKKNGTRFPCEISSLLLRSESGEVIGYVSINRDITERKQAEEALRISEERFRSYFELGLIGMAITSPSKRVLELNDQMCTILGYSREELLRINWTEITHPQDLEADVAQFNRVIAGEIDGYLLDKRWIRKDGQLIHSSIAVKCLRRMDGSVDYFVALLQDITERKLAEEAVRTSEEQYRSLFEDSPISLWVEDFSGVKRRLDQLKASGIENIPVYLREHPEFVSECAHQVKVLDVNSAALKLYHARSKDELVGRLMEILPAIPIEQFERELLMLAGDQLNFEREGTDETLTGEKIHVSLRWTVAPGYEDTLARVIISTVDVTERKRAEENVQLQIQRLRALRSIDLAISSSFNLDLTLDILLSQVTTQLKVDAASVLLFQPFTRKLEYAAGRGFHTASIRAASVKLGEGYAGIAVLERRMIHSSNLTETNPELPPVFLLMLKEEGFVDYYCVPFIVKGEVKGVLEIFHRSLLPDDLEWLDFIETLAGQAAIAIEDATLFENLQRSNQELFQAYDATIEGWSHALDLRDKETEGHTQRVTELTVELAGTSGFTSEQLINVRWGALLHDIGKMGVPDNILLKPDKLTDKEWEIMRKHPTFAYEMLSPIAYLKNSLDIPYCHHEKWDGTGYPRGLKGELIPLAARLFAVIDVWDALRSDRPYRNAWSVEKTMEHIRSLSGTHFDPQAVRLFLEMIERRMET